jgi:hypothetical protein
MDYQSMISALRDRARKFVSLDSQADADLGDMAIDIGAGFVPGLGTAQSARDLERARREGDGLGMGLAGLGLIPFVGGVTKAAGALRKGAKAADTTADALRAYPRAEAIETARKNAVKMLGLPENNTAMQRAKALGFDEPLYRGDKLQPNFDDPSGPLLKPTYSTHETTSDGLMVRPALFASTSPKIASGYAESGQEGHVLPLLYRKGKEAWSDAKGNHWKDFFGQLGVIEANARGARNSGYDAYRIKNVVDPGLSTHAELADTVGIINPANVRSRFAAFDPARVNENDLLGRADPALLAAVGLGSAGTVAALRNRKKKEEETK